MELLTSGIQTVEPNETVTFQSAISAGSSSIMWRVGSGLVTLRGLGLSQPRARFRVSYHGNVALSADAAIEPIEFAILINGEAIASSKTISTPAAVGDFNSVGSSTFIDVASGCCTQISLGNIGTTNADIQNVSLMVERVA